METVRQIADRACDVLGLTYADLMTHAAIRKRGRERDAVQLVYWLARQRGYALQHIARAMRRLDHTTIIHGVKQHEARMARDPLWRELSEGLAGR